MSDEWKAAFVRAVGDDTATVESRVAACMTLTWLERSGNFGPPNKMTVSDGVWRLEWRESFGQFVAECRDRMSVSVRSRDAGSDKWDRCSLSFVPGEVVREIQRRWA